MPASTSGIFSPAEIYRRIAGGKLGRWNPTEVMEGRLDNDWPSPTPYATNLVTPTSISSTGTGNSSSIGANGSVTFSSCATLSLNGVFTSDYDNYMIVCRNKNASVSLDAIWLRLRLSGTDATGTNYVYQALNVGSTSVGASRTTLDRMALHSTTNTLDDGFNHYIYGPNLAQPTAFRTVSASAVNSASIYDYAGTHSLSTAYDGFTMYPATGTFGGLVSVYGLGV